MTRRRLLKLLMGVCFGALVLTSLGAWQVISSIDWSTSSDAVAVPVVLDPAMSPEGAFSLGRTAVNGQGFRYDVEVTAEWPTTEQLFVSVREWQEDGYTVELWLENMNGQDPRANVLVHWSEDSGTRRGYLHNVHGQIHARSLESGSNTTDQAVLLEYRLNGTQRGREIEINRKCVVSGYSMELLRLRAAAK
jgi:hypothetical protein